MPLPTGFTASLLTGSSRFTIDADGTLDPKAGALVGLEGTSVAVQIRITRDSDGAYRDLPPSSVPIVAPSTPTPTPTPTLMALALSSTALTSGIPASIDILNATDGSTITGSSPDGMAIDSADRTIGGTPTTPGDYTLVLSEALAGASNSPRTTSVALSVAAGTPTPAPSLGQTSTTFTVPPTVQFHPHTSLTGMAVRADGTFQGYIDGDTLTVTEFSSADARAITSGMVLKTGAAVGTVIVNRDENSGGGGVGNYKVSPEQTVGSSSSPVTFTVQGDQCVLLPDLMGNGGDLSSRDGYGPVIMQDGYGITFLRFAGGVLNARCWLRNNSYSLNGDMDSHNWTWLMVGRRFSGILMGLGAADAPTATNQQYNYGQLATFEGQVANGGGVNYANSNPDDPVSKRLLIGNQLQVIGGGLSSGDALNDPSGTGDRGGFLGLNEVMGAFRAGSDLRAVNVTGFTLNAQGNEVPSENSGSSGGYFDLYELAGWIGGEMGDRTQAPARFNASMQEAMANYSIPPIARRVIIGGDSRSAYGAFGSGVGGGNDGTQTDIPSLLGERGHPWSLPADTAIIPYAFGGQGIGAMQGLSEVTAEQYGNVPRALATPYLLGGGNDYLAFFMDANDLGNNIDGSSGKWPDTTFGGRAAPGSTDQGDDLFNGDPYIATADVTVNAGDYGLQLTNQSGVIVTGSTVEDAAWGVSANGSPSGGALNILSQALSSHSDEPATFRLRSYADFVSVTISKGVKVLWGPGTAAGPGSDFPGENDNASGRFRHHILNDALDELSAGPGQANDGMLAVFDPARVMLDGKYPLGWPDYTPAGRYIADNIHMTRNGRELLVSGGDTPTLGFANRIKALMGLAA